MMSSAGDMNTKLLTKAIGMRAPRGPTPKLWMMVQMPLTNRLQAMSRACSAAGRPSPVPMRMGAGRVENMITSACCKPNAPSSWARGTSFMP